ncbi:hypothetical protein JQS43_11285 [Natronosporangium hydrolyticum]|uniref:Uncharacterized protein n=1 Tax=Natronosporangium hydrolyticum TaxID=2811111 RepID=A0A895YMW3_9ACTN|nr:hypothetical protein [Natronosporangium hydrolyticum]QSB16809.1 hypothetical protein JQS43_11285 [Natronosporangium hydrolyticum]
MLSADVVLAGGDEATLGREDHELGTVTQAGRQAGAGLADHLRHQASQVGQAGLRATLVAVAETV